MAHFIEIQDLTFTYTQSGATESPLPALHNLSLRIDEGEYVAIVGANGSGKSTLARHLNALLRPQQGQVSVAGMDTRNAAHRGQIRALVGMVFQAPEDQLVATTVEDDVAFGPENLGIPSTEIQSRVQAALETVGLWEQRERPPLQLSAGQMQRVALAGVLALQPRCIVFDEATAMLDPLGRRSILETMDRLHRAGITIVTITHHMEEALRAQRIVALHNGTVVRDESPAQLFSHPADLTALGLDLPPAAALAYALQQRLPNRLPMGLLTVADLIAALNSLPHTTAPPALQSTAVLDPAPWIETTDLSYTYLAGTPLARRALEKINLRIGEHEAHGLLGMTGSGKSTLLQHLNGLLRPQEGHVRIGPYPNLNDPRLDLKKVRRLAGLAFQIPELQIFEQFVGDEIAYGPRQLGLSRPELRENVRWAMETVGLDFETYKDRYTYTLSGGERRKTALASILSLRPEILLLDEPTAGLDPVSRRDLLHRLQRLQNSGLTLIVSSHQMEDLAQLTHRLTLLANGQVAMEGPTGELFSRGADIAAFGMETPVTSQIAAALRERGWPLATGVVTPTELIDQLVTLVPHE